MVPPGQAPLRRSVVTNARRRGVAESVVMKMSGHKTRAVCDRYNVVDYADVRAPGKAKAPPARWLMGLPFDGGP